jgi:hypothetical protein
LRDKGEAPSSSESSVAGSEYDEFGERIVESDLSEDDIPLSALVPAKKAKIAHPPASSDEDKPLSSLLPIAKKKKPVAKKQSSVKVGLRPNVRNVASTIHKLKGGKDIRIPVPGFTEHGAIQAPFSSMGKFVAR